MPDVFRPACRDFPLGKFRSALTSAKVRSWARHGPQFGPDITSPGVARCYELPVAGIDLVEVAPPYDYGEITSALASRVVLEAVSALARRGLDAAAGTRWDPARPLLDGR